MDKVAIFWDYENVRVFAKGINVPLADSLNKYSESVGHPCVKKVYSNWIGINTKIIQALYSLGFEPIQISMGKTNSVDVKIAVDILDIAQTDPSIKYFIIVTGDKDFIPVVNWLKANQKKVIIIGKSDMVSEHLLLSANDFVFLEELSKIYKAREFSKKTEMEEKTISFEDGINCLLGTINYARERGLSTRFELIANLMRISQDFDYNGPSSILNPDNSGTFPSFTKFIVAVEESGKIKTDTIEGFKEIFLFEEDPEAESEFSLTLPDKVDRHHWEKFFEIIIKSFADKTEENAEYFGRFMFLLKHLRISKKEGILPYSHRTIKTSLEKIIEIGFLIRQTDGSYALVNDYDKNLESYIEKIMDKK